MIEKKDNVIVFDCDGVLFDSRESNISYYNHLLSKFGLPLLRDSDVDFVHMHTADECINYLFADTPYLEEALRYRWDMPLHIFIRQMKLESGIIELLSSLKPFFSLAIATNRSNSIGEVLKYHGLIQYFEFVVSSLDVSNPKPHPECIIKIAEFFGVSRDKIVYIGDSKLDEQTAINAGVKFISYKNPCLIADYHASSHLDIRDFILNKMRL